jgi:hypothetical protein
MAFQFRLEQDDGTPADPATLVISGTSLATGDTIPLGVGQYTRSHRMQRPADRGASSRGQRDAAFADLNFVRAAFRPVQRRNWDKKLIAGGVSRDVKLRLIGTTPVRARLRTDSQGAQKLLQRTWAVKDSNLRPWD